MSRIEWEYNLVEQPFCEQLQTMGWTWIEGDVDVGELTERENFREVVLQGRLKEALKRINLRDDGRPWLDEARIAKSIRDLSPATVHRVMEINQAATELLLKGTVVDGLPEWDNCRPQQIRYIDFEHLENNDFLVINQFKVELTSGRSYIIPDAVLFINGIPIVVAEFKSPGIENPMQAAINQLLRYSNQRREALRAAQGATLQSQQVLTAGILRPAHLLDLIRNFTVFQQVDGKTRKVVARYQQFRAVNKATRKLQEGRTKSQGAERDERGGIIWHTQGSGKSLSMVFLVRKMRTLEKLKSYKIVAVTDRTDLEVQLRETARLSGEAVRPTDRERSTRESSTALTQRILSESTPDIVFAMLQKYQDVDRQAKIDEKITMTIVRKEKKPGKEEPIVEREVTFEENIHFEDFPVLNESDEILVLVDEAHRSHTLNLHRNLRRALPNAAIIGFTGTPILSKNWQSSKPSMEQRAMYSKPPC